MLSKPKTKERNLSCRRFISEEKISNIGYIMIGSCPLSWKNTETARACMSTNYTADPVTVLLLLDVTTNVTYANIYCAICHGKSRDLRHWNLRIHKEQLDNISLQDIRSTEASWKAIPVGAILPGKCVVTPPEANTEPETELKQLCRSYANIISLVSKMPRRSGVENRILHLKNPHCALLSNPDLLDNHHVRCSRSQRLSPKMPFMIFSFSADDNGKADSPPLETSTMHVIFNCEINEVYDPFRGRCLPVHSSRANTNSTDVTHKCQGLRFPPHEFRMFNNNSVFVIPHQKLYNNDSYILENQTFILCANFSRNFTRKSTASRADSENLSNHSLTLRIVTNVGFSLSITSLLILLVTYFLFAELRTYPGKRVMHLSCAMIAMQTVYFLSDPDIVPAAVCAVLGALLHYFILVTFLWMSVIALSTQKTFSNLSK